MKRLLIVMGLCVTMVSAQQSGVLNWNPNGSNVTVNAPASSGTVFTYALPGRSGTLALAADVAIPPQVTNGSIALVGGTGSATVPVTTVRCVVSDPSGNSVRYQRLGGTLTVFGAGTNVEYICV